MHKKITARQQLSESPYFERERRHWAGKALRLHKIFGDTIFDAPIVMRWYERLHRCSRQMQALRQPHR